MCSSWSGICIYVYTYFIILTKWNIEESPIFYMCNTYVIGITHVIPYVIGSHILYV